MTISHETRTSDSPRTALAASLALKHNVSQLLWGIESSMPNSFLRPLFRFVLGLSTILCALPLAAQSPEATTRQVIVDIRNSTGPVDRFFDLSVGSDYPGTLIRDDCQAQLKLATSELGFRYIRFHGIFHDVLGTVRIEDEKTVYNWSKIDQLYDDLLARHIRPFVELGFTPKALATSQNSVFYWNGNTSHPKPEGWHDLVDAFIRHVEARYGRDEVRTCFSKCGTSPTSPASGRRRPEGILRALRPDLKDDKVHRSRFASGRPATAGAAWFQNSWRMLSKVVLLLIS